MLSFYTCLRRGSVNATKVSNKEHEVTMELDGQVQPLPCKVAADEKSGEY